MSKGEHKNALGIKWPSAKTAANLGVILARIQQDPSIDRVSCLLPPRADEVEQLRQCLRCAPHVTELHFRVSPETRDLEGWLSALSSATLLDIETEAGRAIPATFALRLTESSFSRVRLFALQGSTVAFVEEQQDLCSLDWTWRLGLDQEELACRMLRAVNRLSSFRFRHGSFSKGMVAALSTAFLTTRTLYSLELTGTGVAHKGGDTLAPLWVALRDAPACALRKLTVVGPIAQFEGLGEFLASATARAHLSELKLDGLDRDLSSCLLPAVTANCLALISLDLSIDMPYATATCTASSDVADEVDSGLLQLTRLRLNVSGRVVATAQQPAQDLSLLRAFITASVGDSGRLSALNVTFHHMGSGFYGQLKLAMAQVTVLELNLRGEDTDTNKHVMAALSQSRCLERLELSSVGKDLASALERWFEQGEFPPTLTDVGLGLSSVPAASFLSALSSNSGLLHLRIDDDQQPPLVGNHGATCVAIVELLRAAPSLQRLTVHSTCFDHKWRYFYDPPVATFNPYLWRDNFDAQVRAAILAHPSLENTNLLDRRAWSTEEADKALLDARRLRRHRLAAHWGQAAIFLVFARNHVYELHGSILPLLPSVSALAGLVLPKSGWTEDFARSAFVQSLFDASTHLVKRACSSRKRKRPDLVQ